MARNSDVSPHVGKLSRSQVYKKKAVYKRKYDTAPAAPKEAAALPEGAKKLTAEQRLLVKNRGAVFYPGEDTKNQKKSRKTPNPTKLRQNITPGTVLILLAGRFRGKRVVFLKQLASGLLLVTGPYKVNGVPLRRVNQAYVIATSTKVDIGSLSVDAKIDDAYFSKDKKASRNGTEGEFFKDGEDAKKAFPESKAADQKQVDKEVLAAVAKVPNLAKYLSATFGLTKGQYPHLLKF
ncbi:60S ribosomal protein L6 [Microbotryomycetes sp. JL221]|nr:60S ribosomal protein L6 [Microbotryomycetes sp. JL221]